MPSDHQTSWADELGDLLRLVGSSDLEELEVEHEGARMLIRRDATGVAPAMSAEATIETEPGESLTVTSPFVGVFRHGGPADVPISEGDEVAAGQTIGAVEAMRILNRIQAERSGVIEAVLVEDGQPVEYGQPLIVVRPTG